ncbi:MAG: glycosyltransferase family 39 protein [Anaerolineales bacterium]|nr:glycosyltransferase family 39 protein [Anaerolineales bacterium]
MLKPQRIAIGIAFISLAWLGALVFDLSPYLRGGEEYRWPYELPAQPLRLLPLLAGLAAYLLGAHQLSKRRRLGALPVWAMAGVVVLTPAGMYIAGDPIFKILSATLSGIATGWHYQAVEITDLTVTLTRWTEVMKAATGRFGHVSLSPPGLVILSYGLNRLMEFFPALASSLAQPLRSMFCLHPRLINYTDAQLAGAWFGLLVPAVAALTAPALYRLGRRTYDETTARWAVIWWPLVPGILLFSPTRDTVFPLFLTLMLACYVEGVLQDRPAWFVLAGVVMSVASFLSFSVLPAVFAVGVLTLLIAVFRHRLAPEVIPAMSRRWPFAVGLWFGLGLSSVWLIFYLVSGLTPFDLLAQGATAHFLLQFDFLLWVILHPYDQFIFAGLPLALLAALSLPRMFRKWRDRRPFVLGEFVFLSVLMTLVILHLSNILRGETGRVLLFLTPVFALAAANVLSVMSASSWAVWAVTGTQALVVLGMAGVLRVVDTEFNRQPAPPPPVTIPAQATLYPSGAVFGGTLQLESFAGQLHKTAGSAHRSVLTLWLNWRSLGRLPQVYYQSLIPVAPDGQALAEQTVLHRPFNDAYATSCWQPHNGQLTQEIEMPLRSELDTGGWWVSLSFYDRNTGEPLPVRLPDGSEDRQVGLGPFFYVPDFFAAGAPILLKVD